MPYATAPTPALDQTLDVVDAALAARDGPFTRTKEQAGAAASTEGKAADAAGRGPAPSLPESARAHQNVDPTKMPIAERLP